jgi:hypothetical protein
MAKKCPHGKEKCGDCTPHRAYEAYRRSAEIRGLRFTITQEEFESIVSQACFYCGRLGGNGADRKQQDQGYEIWNLVSCCALDNFLRGRFTMQQYLQQCDAVSAHQKQKREQAERQAALEQERQQNGTTNSDN